MTSRAPLRSTRCTWTRAEVAASGRSPGRGSRSSRTCSVFWSAESRMGRAPAGCSRSSPRMSRPAGSTRTPQRGNCWGLALRRSRPLARSKPLPIHGVEELLEPGHPVAPGFFQRGDVDVVPDRFEELEHPESIVAHPLPGFLLGLLDISNRMSEFLRQRGREVSEGQLVAGEFHGLADRRLRIVECPGNELPDILHRHELLARRRRERNLHDPSLKGGRHPGARVVVHEGDGPGDRVWDPRGPQVLFHFRLRLEMRNAGVSVRRGDARQDDVRHRCGFRDIDCRRALLDLFLRVYGEVGPERGRDDEEAVRVPNEGSEACALCEITLSAFDSRGGEGFQVRGASCEADDSMSSLEEAASDRPSLLSRRPRHQNRLRLCHPQSPRGPKTSVLLVAVTASDESRRPSWSAAKIEADPLVLESWPPRWPKLRYRGSGRT